ncbi:alanine--tRNA ligase-related protein, partial [Patescibacteria group bacterium]|nr:alanine--tRNA ligase-related protein [Patescibacteria group bacterium]
GEKLYVSVFEGNKDVPKDTESVEIWESLGVPKDHLFYYGVEKNWWSRSGTPEQMPVGEIGGPDSEVFYDFGEGLKLHENSSYKNEKCHPNCQCGRFLEIGNSVFMQYEKKADGKLVELSQKNVDFGGGLERLAAAANNNPDIFQIDLFIPIIRIIEQMSGKSYGNEENKKPMRIIADHLRAATFLMTNGVEPSNKAQGYVLRRLLRRSAVKMHQLKGGLTSIPGFHEIADEVLRIYDATYFDRSTARDLVFRVIEEEMEKFTSSLDKGLKELEKLNNNQLNTLSVFNLYQTHGFPFEVAKELIERKGGKVDKSEFNDIFKKHQKLSRTASVGMFKGGLVDQSEMVTKYHTTTHLLQAALRQVLGSFVHQRGSNLTHERLRFDFSNPEKLTPNQLTEVEKIVNEQIEKNLEVKMEIIDFEKALQSNALTVSGEKYPEKVKVYSIGDFSKEVCGGPHIDFTGKLGKFKIIKEEAVSAGTRRIYATLNFQ